MLHMCVYVYGCVRECTDSTPSSQIECDKRSFLNGV